MERNTNIDSWVLAKNFKLNVYRLPDPQDKSDNPQSISFVVLAPGQSFDPNHPVLNDMGFSKQQSGRGNYFVSLGHDPDDAALGDFVNRLLAQDYDDVIPTPFVREAAFMLNDPDQRLRVISDQQIVDMPADTHIVTDRPFIVVINPDSPGISTGVVIPEISEEEAKRIDPQAFAYQGGMFVHAQYVQRSEWFAQPSANSILVVDDQVFDQQIHTAVQRGMHVYYGGILYSSMTTEQAASSGYEGYVQSYLDDQGRPNAERLIEMMRMVSGYTQRTAQGWDLNDYSIEQQRIANNLHSNAHLRVDGAAPANTGVFVREKLSHYGYGRNLQSFFTALTGDELQGSFHQDDFTVGPTSDLLQSDETAKALHAEARQAQGKQQDDAAFPDSQEISLPDNEEGIGILKLQVMTMLERVRREEMADRASTMVDPIMTKTLRHLIQENLLGSEIDTQAILGSLNRSDLLHTMRRVQNDIIYLHPGEDEILNVDKVVLQAFRKAAENEAHYQPAIMAYAERLSSQERSLSAVDSIARRMLQSPIPSHQVTAQNYFMERLQIFKDAQGLPATDEQSQRLQRLFHTYFNQESPERRGLPTETFLFKRLHSRAYREMGNFQEVLEQFAARYGEHIVNIQQRIAEQVSRGLRNPVDGEPIREMIGDAAYFDYYGVGLETYETRTRTDRSVREQNAYAGRYIYVDSYEFLQEIIQMDKERQAKNRVTSPNERVHNLVYANIPQYNWGEGNVNQAKVFVREEGLHLVPTDLIRRQRYLHEKYLRNRNRDYSGIADHVFVKKGGSRVSGKILRGYSRSVISQTTPTARYDNNEINGAGFIGKGTFVETRYLWMLEDHMLHDMRVAERRQQARQRAAQQNELNLPDNHFPFDAQEVYVRAIRNIFENHADRLDVNDATTRYLVNPDFARGFINGMKLADEQGIGSSAERMDIFNYFGDRQLPRKLAKLQESMPETFMTLYQGDSHSMAAEIAKPGFIHFLHSHVVIGANEPLPDYPLADTNPDADTAITVQKWQESRNGGIQLIDDLRKFVATLPEYERLDSAVMDAYEQAVNRWFDSHKAADQEPNNPFLAQLNQGTFALLNFLRGVDKSARTADGIYRILTANEGGTFFDNFDVIDEKPFRESLNLRTARDNYEYQQQRAEEQAEQEEDEQAENAIKSSEALDQSRDRYAIALLNEQQRISNAYANIGDRNTLRQKYQEELQEIRPAVSMDAELAMDSLNIMVQTEPSPQNDYRAFALHHGFQEGFYRRRDGQTIDGYYFDVHDREFRSAVSEPTHPHYERYRYKVFANVWGDAVDQPENNNHAFVRREALALVPPGIVRENGRLLEVARARRTFMQLAGTEANPDVAQEALLAGEPGREIPGDIYDYYDIPSNYYLTRKGAVINGRYLEVHDEAFKQAVNQLGSRENRIYGSHVFVDISEEAYPGDGAPPPGTIFVRETALDKIPVALIREHARLQQLRRAADYDEYKQLPQYTHTYPSGRTFSGYWIPNFSLQDVRRALPGTVTELVNGQVDDDEERSEFVLQHKVWPMPLVHRDAMPFLPDAMTVDNAMTKVFANNLIKNGKGNPTRIRLIVEAYNSVTPQESQQIHESLDDLINFSQTLYEGEKNDRRRERRQAEREARRAEQEGASSERDAGPNLLNILSAMQTQTGLTGQDSPTEDRSESVEIYRGAAEEIINQYEFSDSDEENAIAIAYSEAQEAWINADEDVSQFNDYFDRADAEARIKQAYEAGILAEYDQLRSVIYGEDTLSSVSNSNEAPAQGSSPDNGQSVLDQLILHGVAENRPEALFIRDVLGMNIGDAERQWIAEEVESLPDEVAQWIFLRAIQGHIRRNVNGYLVFRSGVQSLDDDEVNRALTELRMAMTNGDAGRYHFAAAIDHQSELTAQEVLLLADLAKQCIDQQRTASVEGQEWEIAQLNLFRGWNQVREVKEGNAEKLAQALLNNATISQVYTHEDAMIQAHALIDRSRLAYPVLSEHRHLLWDSLNLAKINASTVADLNSIRGELLPNTMQQSGDAFFGDAISALIAKARKGVDACFMVPHDSFALRIPADHYDLMIVRLSAIPSPAQPVKDVTSGIEFADRETAQLNQLLQLAPGGIGVIIASNDFANKHASAIQQKLPALSMLAQDFEVLSAVNQPLSHIPGFGQMIFLQRTMRNAYAQDGDTEYFAATQRMMADIARKADTLQQAFSQSEEMNVKALSEILANELVQHYQPDVVPIHVAHERAPASPLPRSWTLPAQETVHQVALPAGSYGEDVSGRLFVVLDSYQQNGKRMYTVQDVDSKIPHIVQKQYFALRDALLESNSDQSKIDQAKEVLLQSLSSRSLHDANAQFALEGLKADLNFYRTCALIPANHGTAKDAATLDQRIRKLVPMEGVSADVLELATGRSTDELCQKEMVYALPRLTTFIDERFYSPQWLTANLPEHGAYALLNSGKEDYAVIEEALKKVAIRAQSNVVSLGRRDMGTHHLHNFLAQNLHKGRGLQLEIGLDVRYPKNTLTWQVLDGNALKNPVLGKLEDIQQLNALAHILNGTQYTATSVGLLATNDGLAEVNQEISRQQRKLQAYLSGKGVDRGTSGPREALHDLMQDHSPGTLMALGGITGSSHTLSLGINAWINNRTSDEKPMLLIVGNDITAYSEQLQHRYPNLNVYLLIPDQAGKIERIQEQITAAQQADIVIMPAAQQEKYLGLLGGANLQAFEINALCKDEKTLVSLPGDAKTGLAKKYIGNYLQSIHDLREQYQHAVANAPLLPPVQFSRVVVTAPELYQASQSKAFAAIQALVQSNPGAKLSILASPEFCNDPELNYQVLATNMPRLLDKAQITCGEDLLTHQLLHPAPVVTVPAHEIIYLQAQRQKKQKPGSAMALAKATAELATAEERIAMIFDRCREYSGEDGKAIAIIFDSAYLQGEDDKRENIVAMATEKGLAAIWAHPENNGDIRQQIAMGNLSVVLVDSEAAGKFALPHQVDHVILSALPALDQTKTLLQSIKQLDPYCSKQVWIVAENSIETSKINLMKMAWGRNIMPWPSDKQLLSSPYASALWQGDPDGVNAYFSQEALPQLEKQVQHAEITNAALRMMKTNLPKVSLNDGIVENTEWYVDKVKDQIVLKPNLPHSQHPAFTQLTWHKHPVAVQAVNKVLREEIIQNISIGKATVTNLTFKGEEVIYHPRIGEGNYLYIEAQKGKRQQIDSTMICESAVSETALSSRSLINAVNLARGKALNHELQQVQKQMNEWSNMLQQNRNQLEQSQAKLVEKGYCELEKNMQSQNGKSKKLVVKWNPQAEDTLTVVRLEKATDKQKSDAHYLGSSGS